MNTDEIPQRLYDSEVNFELSTFWDDGFAWKLGDAMNGGYQAEGNARTLLGACTALALAAVEHYPNSHFTREWQRHERALEKLHAVSRAIDTMK